jgi:hypothetical protein
MSWNCDFLWPALALFAWTPLTLDAEISNLIDLMNSILLAICGLGRSSVQGAIFKFLILIVLISFLHCGLLCGTVATIFPLVFTRCFPARSVRWFGKWAALLYSHPMNINDRGGKFGIAYQRPRWIWIVLRIKRAKTNNNKIKVRGLRVSLG